MAMQISAESMLFGTGIDLRQLGCRLLIPVMLEDQLALLLNQTASQLQRRKRSR
ncbi:hypothetical protein ACFSQ7_20155 [Paenibacillus rhizoplanae]